MTMVQQEKAQERNSGIVASKRRQDEPEESFGPATGDLVAADKVVAPDGKSAPAPGANLASDSSKATDAAPPTAPTDGKAPAPAAKPVVDEEVVRIGEIPPDTQCRKVTTELEIRKKKGQETADEKNSNSAIFCQTAPGSWKPASA